MPDWPDKWRLDNFKEALQDWRQPIEPSPEVLGEIEIWHYSRQDNPYGDQLPPFEEEGMFDDYYPVKAGVFDRHRRPVQIDGRPVVAFYEVHENEHCVVFSHFGVV